VQSRTHFPSGVCHIGKSGARGEDAQPWMRVGIFPKNALTLVADTSPPELRGTAYGFFNLLGGFAMLAANVVAGSLWDAGGAKVTFLAGASFTLIALIGLLTIRGRINTKFTIAI
jgi:MFS family permease